VLVTTLTKRLSEDITAFLREAKIRVEYLHSDIDAIERVEILRNLRLGNFDVLVGINLLREGLDLPEVALVAIFGRGQGGIPAKPNEPDPDCRPRGAAPKGPCPVLRRPADGLDPQNPGGDRAPAGKAECVQSEPRNHAHEREAVRAGEPPRL